MEEMRECGEGRKAPSWVVRSEDSCARALEMSSHNTFSRLFKRNEDNSLFVCVAYTRGEDFLWLLLKLF